MKFVSALEYIANDPEKIKNERKREIYPKT